MRKEIWELKEKIADLERTLEYEREHKDYSWMFKLFFERWRGKKVRKMLEDEQQKNIDLEIGMGRMQTEMIMVKEQVQRAKEFVEKLDVENYDLRSDDFYTNRQQKEAKVPKLDMKKVQEWRENANWSEELEEEEEEEEEIRTENEKFFPDGSNCDSNASLSRMGSLLRRKEEVIDLLNKAYESDGQKQSASLSIVFKSHDNKEKKIKKTLTNKGLEDIVNLESDER
jgi:hypothetical protein